MFLNASAANPDVSTWQLPNVVNMVETFANSALSSEIYSAFLVNLQSQADLPSDIIMSVGPQFDSGAAAARAYLVNDLGWTIVDGGPLP